MSNTMVVINPPIFLFIFINSQKGIQNMFMQIALGAIGIGIVLMSGFIIIAQIKVNLPTPQVSNTCYGENVSAAGECFGADNMSVYINDPTFVDGISTMQATTFAGFGLIAVGIIALAAFGIITVFK